VIEDAPYAELRFEGRPQPSLLSLDEHELVVHLGTFSKICCPGLRVGWVTAPAKLAAKYVLVKQGADLHTSTLAQRQLWAYLQQYDLDANLRRLRRSYRQRRDAMLNALQRYLPPTVSYTRPAGGLFLWVQLPAELDARALLARCLERRVAFVPGDSFYADGQGASTLRLSFSAVSPERIVEGVRRLAEGLRELSDRRVGTA